MAPEMVALTAGISASVSIVVASLAQHDENCSYGQLRTPRRGAGACAERRFPYGRRR